MTQRLSSVLFPIVWLVLALGCAGEKPCQAQHANDLRLEPVYRGELKYPAGVSGKSGVVTLRVDVDRDGRVVSATPIDSDPPGIFDAEAAEYVSGWRYCPRNPGEADFPESMTAQVGFRAAR